MSLQLSYDGCFLSSALDNTDLEHIKADLENAHRKVIEEYEDGTRGFLSVDDNPIEIIQRAQARLVAGFTDQIVIGIGGSSLGSRALLKASAKPRNGLHTHFAENLDAHSLHEILERVDLRKTLLIVISKSGTTIETMSQFWILYDKLEAQVGADHAASHVIAITDPEAGSLRHMANQFEFRTFDVPPNIGGRFSVLTSVGLVPLALAGFDVEALLAGANQVAELVKTSPENPLLPYVGIHELLRRQGKSQTVMMGYADRFDGMAEWFCQLWGESLGKTRDQKSIGLTPIRATGAIDQHSQVQLYMEGPDDKHIVFVDVENTPFDFEVPRRPGFPEGLQHLPGKSAHQILRAEMAGTMAALRSAGRPTSQLRFDQLGPQELGAFMMSWMYITATLGHLLDINPYDQPGVELGKRIAHGLLGHPSHKEDAEDARRYTPDFHAII